MDDFGATPISGNLMKPPYFGSISNWFLQNNSVPRHCWDGTFFPDQNGFPTQPPNYPKLERHFSIETHGDDWGSPIRTGTGMEQLSRASQA